jgi:hypothetical protein
MEQRNISASLLGEYRILWLRWSELVMQAGVCYSLVFDDLTLILLMWRIGWGPNGIPMYIQQDATLHSLFISGNCSTYFGWYFHPPSEAHTTVSTAYGTCHTVTAICRYRGRVGTGLSVLWVAYATHSTLKPWFPMNSPTFLKHSHSTPIRLWRWNRVLRNVGIKNSDAGELPSRNIYHA